MHVVDDNCYNSLILGVMNKDLAKRVNPIEKNFYSDVIIFNFDSFIKSQISFKVLDMSYLTLLQSCIMYKSIESGTDLGVDFILSLKYMAREFIEKFCIVGMYLSLYRNLKIDLRFPSTVFEKLFNFSTGEDFVYLIRDYSDKILDSNNIEEPGIVKVKAFLKMDIPSIESDINIDYLCTLYNIYNMGGEILNED